MFYFWLLVVFAIGVGVGGVVNYCFYRLPLEKSILWPGPRCGLCWQPIRWFDNIPLVGYCVLGGRCRTCGGRIPARHLVVELLTGLLFAGLFYAEIGRNIMNLPFLHDHQKTILEGHVPAAAWAVFATHAVLMSFLLLTSLCDLDDMAIPLPITITGTLIGLGCSMFFAWPWPDTGRPLPPASGIFPPHLDPGLYPWPVWYPLPDWLPPGSWQLGLATGLAGALAGMMVMRVVRFLFGLTRGIEALGVGDADLMMMAGSFVGWQPVLLSCFVAAFPGLLFGVAQLARRGNQTLPFGPSLAIGVLMTLWLWPYLDDSESLRLVFFHPLFLGSIVGGGTLFLLLAGLLFRFVLGPPTQEPSP
ncbi:MAG TPA: prepilin peptidase [Gemmataceae bacterium]|jgi:leader peptidase (prepilin peptidase)/N-methyltransferase